MPVEAPSVQITSIASNRSFASMASMDGLAAQLSSPQPRRASGSETPPDTYVRRSSGLSMGDRDAAVTQAAELSTPSQRTGASTEAGQPRVQGQQQRQHRSRAAGNTPPTSLSGSESFGCTIVAAASFKRCVLWYPQRHCSWLSVWSVCSHCTLCPSVLPEHARPPPPSSPPVLHIARRVFQACSVCAAGSPLLLSSCCLSPCAAYVQAAALRKLGGGGDRVAQGHDLRSRQHPAPLAGSAPVGAEGWQGVVQI